MLDKLFTWIEKLTHTSLSDWVRTALFLASVLILRAIVYRLITRHKNLSLETKRQWALYLRNLAFVLAIVGLIVIWSNEIRSLALSMAAVAVAVAVSIKELITCALSSVLRTVPNNSYKLGDYIQVGRFRGRVTDINLLTTTLMEMGPANAFQFSGKVIVFPNSLLFAEAVIRLDANWAYVAHTVEVVVPYAFSVETARDCLSKITYEVCEEHLEPARRYMERLERRQLTDTPSVEPRFSLIPVDEKYYKLLARVVVLQSELLHTEQEIVFRFMREIQPLLAPHP